MTMRAKITNTSRANQGVYTDEGLVHLEAGETRTLTIAPDYVGRVKALPFLTVDAEAPAKDPKAPKQAVEPGALPSNVMQLKALAKEESIDLGAATKGADIKAVILAARERKALLAQAEADHVEIEADMSNADIIAAIELAREAGSEA